MSQEYPADWDSRRRKVYKRDDYTCQNCGAEGGSNGDAELHAHHIVPKSKGGLHQLENLKTMCSECHNAIHGGSMAPTAHRSEPTTTQGFFSRLRDATADGSFNECPLCKSPDMNSDNVSVGSIGCANCGVEFEKRGHGFAIVSMDEQLLGAGLPINYSNRMKGYALRPSIWHKVGSADDVSQLDYDRLEEGSEEEEKNAFKTVLLVPLILIAIYFSVSQFTSSLQTTILLGFAVATPILLYIGRTVAKTDINIDGQ